jgi:hypothetical protein
MNPAEGGKYYLYPRPLAGEGKGEDGIYTTFPLTSILSPRGEEVN